MSKDLVTKVAKIQTELKAPKSQYNSFGKYSYRNQEDILEAVKPLLAAQGLVLTITDEVTETMSGRVYVKAIATITDGVSSISNSALAREADEQKGMNLSQITGSTSSYARKYALNGLFLIDDTKDADTDVVTAQSKGVAVPAPQAAPEKAKAAPATKSSSAVVGGKVESNAVQASPAPAKVTSEAPKKSGWAAAKKTATPVKSTSSSEELY